MEAGRREQQTGARGRSASYDAATGGLTIELTDDVVFIVPRRLIQGLADATPEQVAEVHVNYRT